MWACGRASYGRHDPPAFNDRTEYYTHVAPYRAELRTLGSPPAPTATLMGVGYQPPPHSPAAPSLLNPVPHHSTPATACRLRRLPIIVVLRASRPLAVWGEALDVVDACTRDELLPQKGHHLLLKLAH